MRARLRRAREEPARPRGRCKSYPAPCSMSKPATSMFPFNWSHLRIRGASQALISTHSSNDFGIKVSVFSCYVAAHVAFQFGPEKDQRTKTRIRHDHLTRFAMCIQLCAQELTYTSRVLSPPHRTCFRQVVCQRVIMTAQSQGATFSAFPVWFPFCGVPSHCCGLTCI